MGRLTEDQIAFYREQGYLVLPDAIDRARIAEFSRIVDDWTDRAKGVRESDEFFDLEDSHHPDAPRVRRFKSPVRNHGAFDALARDPAVLKKRPAWYRNVQELFAAAKPTAANASVLDALY